MAIISQDTIDNRIDASKQKIKANLDKMVDPVENIHKTVSIKAGLLPSTAYAIKFCTWLKDNTVIDENGSCDWYIITEDGNSKIDGKILKQYKKEWLLERANDKSNKTDEEISEDDNESKEELENASTTKEKIDALKNRIDVLETNINKTEKEISSIQKSLDKINPDTDAKAKAQYDSLSAKIATLNERKSSYQSELNSINENNELETLKQQYDAEKDNAKKQQKEDKNTAKNIAWWANKLKSWKQKELLEEDDELTKLKLLKIFDTTYANQDELNKMAAYIINNASSLYHISNELMQSKKFTDEQIDNICRPTWNAKLTILGFKDELSDAVKANLDNMTPDASKDCFSGQMSNTFELAKQAKTLYQNPEIIAQRAALLAELPALAIQRLTQTAMKEVENSVKKILDLSPITNIPKDAAMEMTKLLMGPADILQQIANEMNPQYLAEQFNKENTAAFNAAISKLKEVAGLIDHAVGAKLAKYTKHIFKITNTINQAPDWYIDNVNKLEYKAEKEIIASIQDVTIPVLDYKFQFVDFLTAQIAYNLVAPINHSLKVVQLEVLRKIEEVKKFAISKAKALAAKAIMKILGLLGA